LCDTYHIINAGNWIEFGTRLDKSTRETSLEVVGNMTGAGAHIQAGYAAYGGSNNLGGVNCNGNGLGGGACLAPGADLSGKAADLADQLYDGAQGFASLLGNGDLFINGITRAWSTLALMTLPYSISMGLPCSTRIPIGLCSPEMPKPSLSMFPVPPSLTAVA